MYLQTTIHFQVEVFANVPTMPRIASFYCVQDSHKVKNKTYRLTLADWILQRPLKGFPVSLKFVDTIKLNYEH